MFDPRVFRCLLFKKHARNKHLGFTIKKIWMSIWEEHCTECAVPLCYSQCLVFKARGDGKCSRIKDGIVRNNSFSGLLGYGLECSFNKWGKIESRFYPFSCKPITYRFLSNLNYHIYLVLLFIDKKLHIDNNSSLIRRYRTIRNNFFLKHYSDLFPDAFFIECVLINKPSVCVTIQFDDNFSNVVFYSQIHTIHRGTNRIVIPFDSIRFDYSISPADYAARLRVFIAPINEESETDIVFTFLNFISKETEHRDLPSEFIKCMAWDLDDTIWEGTFSEIGQEVSLKEEALKAVQSLDNRGILNTIISKNDYSDVLSFMEKIGIKKYFVLPAINWGSKSENIQKLSSGLNISLDAFAFIDDNLHELREVKANCPQVRVYSIQDLNRIIDLPEFNPPLSKFSKGRREQYQAEIERKRLYLSSYPNDYQEYLRQLNIQLQVRPIENTSVFDRCYELVARSNQYNLRTVRYGQSEFQQLVMSSKAECFAVSAKDLYGDYGIICFFSLEFEDYTCKVLDLVFSCRIARKKIESEIIKSIQEYSIRKGCSKLQLTLIRTPKNTPLMNVLDALPFIRKDLEVQIEYSIEEPNKIITEKTANVDFK